jgi:hypothetical protein
MSLPLDSIMRLARRYEDVEYPNEALATHADSYYRETSNPSRDSVLLQPNIPAMTDHKQE